MERPSGHSRRSFLRLATGAAVAAGGSAMWTQTAAAASTGDRFPWERHIPVSRIGIQLYSLRDLMAQSVEDTLTFVAGVGYTEVEPAGLFGYSPRQFAQLLRELDLQAPSSHVSIPRDEEARTELFENARTMGQKWVTLPYFKGQSIDDYKRLADHLNEAGAEARRHGLRVAYHNHNHEFTPINGKVPYDVLLERTAWHLVDFEIDIYWAIKGGVDPVDLFRRAPRRFPLTHVKDMAPDGSFADVGEGTIDFGRIFAHRILAGFQHHFVERDDQPHPKETARDSFQYLRNLEFGWGRGWSSDRH